MKGTRKEKKEIFLLKIVSLNFILPFLFVFAIHSFTLLPIFLSFSFHSYFFFFYLSFNFILFHRSPFFTHLTLYFFFKCLILHSHPYAPMFDLIFPRPLSFLSLVFRIPAFNSPDAPRS